MHKDKQSILQSPLNLWSLSKVEKQSLKVNLVAKVFIYSISIIFHYSLGDNHEYDKVFSLEFPSSTGPIT